MFIKLLFSLLGLFLLSCGASNTKTNNNVYTASNSSFIYSGRTEKTNDSTVALIGSAAHVTFSSTDDSITLLVGALGDSNDYIVIELNGIYHGRFKVMKDSIHRIPLILPKEKNNEIGLYKVTEASNGPVLFYGVEATSIETSNITNDTTIEFIGDSITCGFGADMAEIHCDKDNWYDQHNAYLAYGPTAARALKSDYYLSSVSGMGIYRNWNDQDTDPVMKDVYATTYLDGNRDKKWETPSPKPDLVSICLGTNDLSNGDGKKERKAFDAEKFTLSYISFVHRIFERYPDTKLALLTSPMVSGDNGKILLNCLKKVQSQFEKDHIVEIHEFSPLQPSGCGGHPSLNDHKIMANGLVPFYTNLLEK